MAAALCYGSRGGGAALAVHHQPGACDTDSLIGALGELPGWLGGQKASLLWDGLPAHRSHTMRAWLRRQRSWLVVEPLPAYAPELNPVEPLWSNLKGVERGDDLVGRRPTDDAGRVVLRALPAGLDEQALCVGHEGPWRSMESYSSARRSR
jgi:hypothetical protein